ncbi:HcaE Phenylpropionate dioxygenase and related ring-hydroxylating dioxygenases, large terminal subunit [Burkholderiaceae bacterium]
MSAELPNATFHPLVQDDRVHRDLYTDADLFAQEQQRFFGRAWVFAGHGSQMPEVGDFITVSLSGQPILLLRDAPDRIQAFFNRCAHKGSQLYSQAQGHVGKMLRCPYHAWSYRLDGQALARPLKDGYVGTGLDASPNGQGLTRLPGVHVYREFVFVRLSPEGLDFDTYFGDALRAIDNMVERSPVGRLEVAGGVLRNTMACNWKMYLENINDSVHPVSAHESASSVARQMWQQQPSGAPMPMAMEQILPFANGYDFFDQMGARIHPQGHSLLGVNFSIHSAYAVLPEYQAALEAAWGVERTQEVLQRSPQNAVLYPSIALKGSPLSMRVIRPLAVDRTLVEAWSFRAVGAPDVLLERAMTYNRLVFSPMSVVAHDDVHLFESIQQGLQAQGQPWVSLHRNHQAGESAHTSADTNSANEWLMRNQYRAWAQAMAQPLASELA